ncbi:Vanillin dehydrogenase [Penicillium cosmopolitanum]|uniref:Vanillin dehydrogenase n=1 Tax=Penicillium cosmopolitanum TaxID=1131564 RepID=A0A9W9W635_9EURO|nr:Vanillin dehydrogenase [Penicillium cosmopolitanum]KAJ5404087.1 Vanillin dehydrogenase [Penicillium cosmopolitanum]
MTSDLVEQASVTVPFIINGKDVTSTSTFKVIDPATGEQVAEAVFPSWSQTKPSFRRDTIFRAADLFFSRKQELLSYQSKETGAGVQFMEISISATVQILRDLGGRIEAAVQVKEPYSVVLAIAPWNAPYVLGARSVAFALATGNTTIRKGSEMKPNEEQSNGIL